MNRRKPDEIHKLEGTHRKDRHGDGGPKFRKLNACPPPPADFHRLAAELWEQTIPELIELDLAAAADMTILEHAFRCYGMAMDIVEKITAEYKSPAAYLNTLEPKDKNLIKEYRDLMEQYSRVMYKFGITPVERSKMPTGGGEGEEDTLDALMKRLRDNQGVRQN